MRKGGKREEKRKEGEVSEATPTPQRRVPHRLAALLGEGEDDAGRELFLAQHVDQRDIERAVAAWAALGPVLCAVLLLACAGSRLLRIEGLAVRAVVEGLVRLHEEKELFTRLAVAPCVEKVLQGHRALRGAV